MAVVYPWEPPAAPNAMLDAALAYARLGIPVFPTHGVRNGACSCGSPDCASPAKHPATPHGWHDATTDEARIRAWWGKAPYLNIARPTGDTIVLDVDPRNGGSDSLERLEARYGKLPDTWHVLTGGNGQHFSFTLPPGTKLKTAHPISPAFPGIDLQASGAYVLLPPSMHISGRTYAAEASSDLLEGQPVAPAPGWLISLCELHREAERATGPTETHPAFPSELADARAALAKLDPDCPYDTWVRIGQALHSTCWQEAYTLWRDWSAEGAKWCGDTELRKKWRSFDANRSAQVTINTLYWEAKQATPRSTDDSAISPSAEKSRDAYLDIASILSEPLNWRWLVQGLLQEGRIYQLFGPWKAGKSLVAMNLALHLAAGTSWGGRKSQRALVVYVAGEAVQDIAARIKGHDSKHGLPGNLLFWLRTRPVYLTDKEHAAALRAEIEAFQAGAPGVPVLLIVDTLARNFGAGKSESNDTDMGDFINNLIDEVVRPTNATGLVVHHSGHADKERGRGHSSLPAAVDGTLAVSKLNDIVTLTSNESRNTAGKDVMHFRVESVSLPYKDNFDEAITVPVLSSLSATEAAQQQAEPQSKHLRSACAIAERLAVGQASTLKAQGLSVPQPVLVQLEDVREAFMKSEQNYETAKKAWTRIKDDLVRHYGGINPLKVEVFE